MSIFLIKSVDPNLKEDCIGLHPVEYVNKLKVIKASLPIAKKKIITAMNVTALSGNANIAGRNSVSENKLSGRRLTRAMML